MSETTKYKLIFDKVYLLNWIAEKFIVNKVPKTSSITYEIKDLADGVIKGKFYIKNLTLFEKTDNDYKVEKILRRQTRNGIREILVK